jgi:tetratricopeptide (TPR) repeat protein
MRSTFFLLFSLLLGVNIFAQQLQALDTLKRTVEQARTPAERIYWMDKLALATLNISPARSDSLGQEMIREAEESRDRRLMVQSYMGNGYRMSMMGGNRNRQKQAVDFYLSALKIAEVNKVEDLRGAIYLRLAVLFSTMLEKDKGLDHANLGASVIATLDNDSLRAEAQMTYGVVYFLRNEKILSLRFLLNGLRIAERLKDATLMRAAYLQLSNFYKQLEDYDKAIDYYTLATQMLEKGNEKNVHYHRVIDVGQVGNLYSLKKNYDIAISYFQRSIRMADSLHFTNLKVPALMSLFNQYLRRDQPRQALAFFNSPEGEYLKGQLRTFGMSGMIDQAYGITYTQLGSFDSARAYLDKASPFFEKTTSVQNQMYFAYNKARLFKGMGNTDSSIFYFEKLKRMGEETGTLENTEAAAKELDSLYLRKGNYQLSREYFADYNLYKDSIEALSKEKELAQEEAADELQRHARLEEERIEKEKRRNNIQYLGIVFGIFGLFLSLVILGMFKVSATLIRGLGFFAFLLFFEFIFLIFKKNIHTITHGEPWKDLAFMIALAAILVPLHHYLEKRVLHYLTSHNLLTGIRQRIFRKSGTPEP